MSNYLHFSLFSLRMISSNVQKKRKQTNKRKGNVWAIILVFFLFSLRMISSSVQKPYKNWLTHIASFSAETSFDQRLFRKIRNWIVMNCVFEGGEVTSPPCWVQLWIVAGGGYTPLLVQLNCVSEGGEVTCTPRWDNSWRFRRKTQKLAKVIV